MKRARNKAPVVKTSISLPQIIADFAQQQADAGGHNSFSAYVEHLIRLKMEQSPASAHHKILPEEDTKFLLAAEKPPPYGPIGKKKKDKS